MGSTVTTSVLAVIGAAPGQAGNRGLALPTLVSWLVTEALGAWMLARWIASGGIRQRSRPDSVPRAVIFGHAGLALTGFACWLSFLATTSAALAWLGLGFLTLAIGFGAAIVTVWTPYPAPGRPAANAPAVAPGGDGPAHPGPDAPRPDARRPDAARPGGLSGGRVADEMLTWALADAARTSKLVDDLLARLLAAPRPAARRRTLDLTPLIPAAHGVMAMVTLMLATLAAIATTWPHP